MLPIQRSVTCPWCRTYYASYPISPNCVNCGGPLPKASSAEKGEKPDGPPRVLPKKYINQVMYWRNTYTLLGIIFMVVGTPFILAFGFGLIFVGVGYFSYKQGIKIGNKKIQALSNGIATDGIITDISKDTTQSINGRNPFIIQYVFTTKDGIEQTDSITSWDDNNIFRENGEEIWVVYIAENPTISSPWPPIV